MSQSIIQQWNRLVELGHEYRKTTEALIEAAQKVDPNIKTRGEALALVEKLKQGRGIK